MKKEGESHLPAPPVGCSCLDDGLIPTAPPYINCHKSVHLYLWITSVTILISRVRNIQVFHILHHHTMKLLLAFKSFMLGRSIVEFDSENWFPADCPIRQRKLFRYWRHNSSNECYFAAANTFCGNECYFAADNSISAASHKFPANNTTSAANHTFAVDHTIRQRMLIRCSQLSFGSESQIRCKQHNSAANANSL
jgi:hypothetical protein